MLRKKSISGLLAVILLAGGFVYTRHQWRKTVKTAPVESKNQDHAAVENREDEAEEKPAPEPEPKATVLSTAAREHLTEKAFISALRAVFLWRGAQTASEDIRDEWLNKLAAIPSDGLPPERKAAWQSLLQAWQSLADPAQASDPALKQQGRQAADVINTMLQEHGDGDILF